MQRSRIHIKMLSGDYPSFSNLSHGNQQQSYCRLCHSLCPHQQSPEENIVHILTQCKGTWNERTQHIPNLLNMVSSTFPDNEILSHTNHRHLTQFILDPTSLNLPMTIRIPPSHPALINLLDISRNICFAIHKARRRQIKIYHTLG